MPDAHRQPVQRERVVLRAVVQLELAVVLVRDAHRPAAFVADVGVGEVEGEGRAGEELVEAGEADVGGHVEEEGGCGGGSRAVRRGVVGYGEGESGGRVHEDSGFELLLGDEMWCGWRGIR